MRSSLTCLSIREDTSVVPVECIVENIPAETFEYCLLRGKVRQGGVQGVETMVERKSLWLFSGREKAKLVSVHLSFLLFIVVALKSIKEI